MQPPKPNTGDNKSAYVKTRYKWAYYSTMTLALVVWVFIAIYSRNVKISLAGVLIPMAVGGCWLQFADSQLETQLFQKYAELHKYVFTNQPESLDLSIPLQKIGHDHQAYNLLSGVLPSGLPFKFFFCKLTMGYVQNPKNYTFMVVSLILPEASPHLLLSNGELQGLDEFAEDPTKHVVNSIFQSPKKYKLEGNFGRFYQFYGEADDPVDMLEIVNPASMQKLMSISGYDIELVGNTLTLYGQLSIFEHDEPTSAQEIDAVLDTAQAVATIFIPILERMHIASQATASATVTR